MVFNRLAKAHYRRLTSNDNDGGMIQQLIRVHSHITLLFSTATLDTRAINDHPSYDTLLLSFAVKKP